MQAPHSSPEYALAGMATQLRLDCVEATMAANWGCPSSCSSIAEIMSVLFFHPVGMKCFPDDMMNFANDKVMLCIGHAAPMLYACWKEAGRITRENFMNYCKPGSNLEGFLTNKLDFVDISTGELGIGLNAACGMAVCMKQEEMCDSKIFCVMGDIEMQEGSYWEALNFASSYRLDNLIMIVDFNGMQMSGRTCFKNCESLADRFAAFGCNTAVIDGHNIKAIIDALDLARQSDKPFAIIAKTVMGKDFLGAEGQPICCGESLGQKMDGVMSHLRSKLLSDAPQLSITQPRKSCPMPSKHMPEPMQCPNYPIGSCIDMHEGMNDCLAELCNEVPDVMLMSSDTTCMTMNAKIKTCCMDKVLECFLAEQHLIGAAMGVCVRDKIPVCVKRAPFLTRAHGMMHNAAISNFNLKIIGCCAGLMVGKGGPTNTALNDLAFARTMPNCRVLYPSDATSCFKAIDLACRTPGNFYIRVTPKPMPVIYNPSNEFALGKCQMLRQSDQDCCTIVCGGATLKEALDAYEMLAGEGIRVCIVDLFSISPIDCDALRTCAMKTHRVLTVEDSHEHGGMCDAVCEAIHGCCEVKISHLFVRNTPTSASDEEMMERNGLGANCIARKVKEMLNS